jgi:hypothetical protein
VLFWRPVAPDNSPNSKTAPVFGHDLARSARPTVNAARSLRRLVSIWVEKVSIAVVLVAALFGVSRLANHASRPDRELETGNRGQGGGIVRLEVLRLWLPESLSWLAKLQSRSPVARDHDDLRRFLEFQGLEDLCYALTIRLHQLNGEFADITYLRHPYDEPHNFLEFVDVLATAAGNPPPCSNPFTSDFTNAAVQVVPEDSWNRSPRAFIVEQLKHPSPPGDQERYP